MLEAGHAAGAVERPEPEHDPAHDAGLRDGAERRAGVGRVAAVVTHDEQLALGDHDRLLVVGVEAGVGLDQRDVVDEDLTVDDPHRVAGEPDDPLDEPEFDEPELESLELFVARESFR